MFFVSVSYVLGKGGFGKVWRIKKKKERKEYAIKEMSKARILEKRSVNSVLNEKKILNHIRHP
jgi:serine/threonine protein kinase